MKLELAEVEERIEKTNEDNERLKRSVYPKNEHLYVYFIRLLAEQAEEAKMAATTAKQNKKEAQFLQQKSEEYEKIIASLEAHLLILFFKILFILL